MKFVVRAATIGLMRKLMKAAGTRTKWTATVYLDGKTVKVMRVNL